jgi:hypothetical protein
MFRSSWNLYEFGETSVGPHTFALSCERDGRRHETPTREKQMIHTRIRLAGLVVVAVLAMSAIGASAALAALPEQTPTTGKFTGTGGKSTFETKAGSVVECKEAKVEGETTGAKTSKSTIAFKGCTAFGLSCNSAGAAAGEIVLKVTGLLVYLPKKEGVGLINTLSEELTIKCTAFQTLKVKGSTLCPITPTNKKTKEYKVICTQVKGVQQPTKYINEKGEEVEAPTTKTEGKGLKTFPFEQSALEGTNVLTFATEGEIKA